MENKVIHYCWFGGKPLPKKFKMYMESWKKFLPDYEIIEWNEKNIDVNECPFIKEAYENKKWAFVADYARTKAIYEMGGLYLDTDVMITKDISDIINKEGTFLGIEDSMMVNAAVWGASKPHTKFAKQMLDFYQSQNFFDIINIYKMSIPRVITRILDEYGLDPLSKEIQVLDKDIYIYPRDYFYPLSYDFQDNVFTDNTCMIHYFDASWITKREKLEAQMIRKVGEKNTYRAINAARFVKRNTKRAAKLVLYPYVLYRRYKKRFPAEYNTYLEMAKADIKLLKKPEYIIMHNPQWLGVTSATKELFENRVRCAEILKKSDVKEIGDLIISTGTKQLIFSAMCDGWKDLARYVRNKKKDIKIKVFWHGSNSQVSEPYGWTRNIEIIELHKEGIIDVFATCKKSIIPFYKSEGYNTMLIRNNVVLPEKIKGEAPKDNIKIGIYAAKSDDWRKNLFAQLAAVSLIPNAVVDMVPLSNEAKTFAYDLGLTLEGEDKPLPREELLKRMSNNSLNLYVTFSECAPMMPVESFEVGVPCVSGDNHHYFEDSELEKYTIVNNEASAVEISKQILKCLDNKDKVMKLYKEWKKENNKLSKESVKEFLEK